MLYTDSSTSAFAAAAHLAPSKHDPFWITTPDGDFSAYVARPAGVLAPAIVVVHEVFGLNNGMRETCQELAARGYLVICPDLYWRLDRGAELSDRNPGDWERALALYQAFDIETGIADIAATIGVARAFSARSGKVGLLGYSMGGLLTFLSAARANIDACVAYYGINLDRHLAEVSRARSPLLLHLAEEDEFVSQTKQSLIVEAALRNPRMEAHTYAGCGHGFARREGRHFDARAAETASARTHEFFRKYLRHA